MPGDGPTVGGMSETIVSDRRASWEEVAARRTELRAKADACGLSEPRLSTDGGVTVHAPDPGDRLVSRFAAAAAGVVGMHVPVIPEPILCDR